MERVDRKKKLRPSILDRLLDNDPHNRHDVDPGRYTQLKALRDSVRRDLENLMNTRYRIVEPPDAYPQLARSLLNYGLPDLATVNTIDIEKKREFTGNLESILRNFEPRFKSVRVTCLENTDQNDRTLRFRIEAVLYADPAPESVVFDSVLEPVTRTVDVEEVGHG
jgi:type VI secretion system protein ImpF